MMKIPILNKTGRTIVKKIIRRTRELILQVFFPRTYKHEVETKRWIKEVEMEMNYALEDDEVEDGYILTCQSHPRSEKVVVSFDD